MAVAKFLILAILGFRALADPTAEDAPARGDHMSRSLQEHESGLRSQMRHMMEEEDDEDDFISQSLRGDTHRPTGSNGGFLQVQHKRAETNPSSMDDYIKDSENGLSAALGPRWDARTLNDNAEKSTQALLHGISGGKAMKKLNGMMGAMMAMR